VSEDVEWRLLEWVEGPAAERPGLLREVRARHPEIEGLGDEWLRVDVVCGRDGIIPLDDNASGYVLDSLSLAIAAILDPRPLSEVLIDIVRIGNDTDTNAAIAGGLLGARDGASAIPVRWRELLQFGDEFTEAAAVLADTTS
jgi:hypothetical protein